MSTYLAIHAILSTILILTMLVIMLIRPNLRIYNKFDLKWFVLCLLIGLLVPYWVLIVGYINVVRVLLEEKPKRR